MSAYHVNPATGKVGVCSAVKTCRFGTASEDHHPTPEAAREAYEASMADYSVPTPMDKEIEARRSNVFDWETLRDELDLETARDLYYSMRERGEALDAKWKAEGLTDEEGSESHDLDHQTTMMFEVWEIKRAEQLATLTPAEVRNSLLAVEEKIKDNRKVIIAARKANDKAKDGKQQDLSELWNQDRVVMVERNALLRVKAAQDSPSKKR